ncbi:Fcf1-domain-containing protein [Thelephora terrestris]|uniref:U three protein 23 n=1 Tax=Thelephora terrestris TaxID=56493 RepID=A0A9P6HP75_9AGAM|nr:Fcf1-domain-containing protein [Thelephora terrestris]
MRQKRAKAYRKLMAMYSMNFGFRQPYQVLIDSEMCKTAHQGGMDLSNLLTTVLQGTVKLMITQCSIHELYLQGKPMQPVVDLAKSFDRRKCNHREVVPGDACLKDVIGETNKHRYVVATQSQSLRSSLRCVPAVPIVHVNRSVMILEPPSGATLKTKERSDEAALRPAEAELSKLSVSVKQAEIPRKKKKGPMGPNPLSVKKKKPAVTQIPRSEPTSTGSKRKREDEQDVADTLAGASQARSGHKRKRRRKTETKLSTGNDCA